ncbi:MAG: sulfatase [Gemmatimonadota bacterium]|nr:sulfatase [Gemmatimonadota bacterium]
MNRLSTPTAYAVGAGIVIALAVVTAEWVVPSLIRDAHAGESFPVFNEIISGAETHPVEDYLADWRRVSRPGVAALAAVLVLLGLRIRSGGRGWRPLERLIGGDAPLGFRDVVFVGIAFGILAGVLETTFSVGRHFLNGYVGDRYYPEILWMGPLSATLAFAAIALALAAFAALAGTRWGPQKLAAPLALLTVWSLLQAPGFGLLPWAEVVLALGLSVAVARGVASHPRGFGTATRRASLLLVPLLLAGSAAGWIGGRGTAVAVPETIRDENRPNVLLIFLDTVRAANLGAYGYERETTPTLTDWATRSVLFEHAIAPASWTLPSHASVFTGRTNVQLGTGVDRALGDEYATLAEVLETAGYRTGGFVANFAYTTRASGLDRGFQEYRDFDVGPALLAASSWSARALTRLGGDLIRFEAFDMKPAVRVADEFLEWVEREDPRPFFAFLNFFDAHDPYVAPAPYRDRFGPPPVGRTPSRAPDPETTARWVNKYDGAIAYIDDQLGRIRRALDSSGRLDGTLVIITSDHGEQFGEHGLMQHTGSLYIPTLHVPLVMSLPGVLPEAAVVPQVVSLRDVAATVLDIVGVDGASRVGGQSLVPLLDDPLAPRSAAYSATAKFDWLEEWIPASRGDLRGLVDWPYHYVRFGDGEEALFDLERDPGETTDLFESPELANRAMRVRTVTDSIAGAG